MVFKRHANGIKNIIKENGQYLNAELDVVKESKEGIQALKDYANIETPSLEDAINTLANTFQNIENARQDKVNNLREKFIGPLEELLEGFDAKQKEIREAADAKKDVEKAKNAVEKQHMKRIKGRLDHLDRAKADLADAIDRSRKEQEDVQIATNQFNRKKLETLQIILKNLVDVERIYHTKVMELLGSVEQKAEAIKIEEECAVEIPEFDINLDEDIGE